jgi:hypothetical protein
MYLYDCRLALKFAIHLLKYPTELLQNGHVATYGLNSIQESRIDIALQCSSNSARSGVL